MKKWQIVYITSLLYIDSDSVETAKVKRKAVREAMKNERSGWGITTYYNGISDMFFDLNENSSDVEFFDSFHEIKNISWFQDTKDI